MSTPRISAVLRPLAMALAGTAMLIAMPASALSAEGQSAAAIATQVTGVPVARALSVGGGQRDALPADPGPLPAGERQAADALRRRGVLLVLRRGALGDRERALGRFGTFSQLSLTSSTTDDTLPGDAELLVPRRDLYEPLPDPAGGRALRQHARHHRQLPQARLGHEAAAEHRGEPRSAALRARARLDPVHRDRGPLRPRSARSTSRARCRGWTRTRSRRRSGSCRHRRRRASSAPRTG